MRSSLIIRLVEAHCSGQETAFENALTDLIDSEEAKGNLSLATSLKKAYRASGNTRSTPSDSLSLPAFSTQGLPSHSPPRDKESLLELYEVIQSTTSLDDVVIPTQQYEALARVIAEQRHSERLFNAGMAPANRLLLCGPPGCGKTMTAFAVAHELGLPIAYVRLDGLVSSYLGQTSTNLRRVFDSVRDRRIVLFLDEFDAIAKKRDDAHELGELKRVVTTLLQNFDSLSPNVLLVAATNHEHLLDPAIWRRFNTSIMLGSPDTDQRSVLLNRWFREYGIAENGIDTNLLARVTDGLSCSQLKELILSYVRRSLISDNVEDAFTSRTEELLSIFLKQATYNSEDRGPRFWEALHSLRDNGVSMRDLERITNIPKSTLSYNLKRETTQ